MSATYCSNSRRTLHTYTDASTLFNRFLFTSQSRSAIHLSLRCVQKSGSHSNSNILLISDSQVAIENISKPLFKRKTPPIIIFLCNILQCLLYIFRTIKPISSGIFGNERADLLSPYHSTDRTTIEFHFPH